MVGGSSRPDSSTRRALPTRTCRPSTVAAAPRPASDSNAEAPRGASLRSPAARTTARASGCSESASTAAVSASSASSSKPGAATMPASTGSPRVSVPVLSKMTTCTSRRALQRQPVLDQQPVARAERGADGDHQRDGQAQGVRAGDDQHRRRADQRLLGLAERGPDHERDDARAERHEEEQRGGTVRQHLRVRLRGLGLGDQPHDPGQGGLLADGGDPNAQAAAGSDGAGHDLLAGLLGDRARLAGDHRFVDIGRALDHRPIGGDARPRPHQDDVADGQRLQRHDLRAGRRHPLGRVGQQLRPARRWPPAPA